MVEALVRQASRNTALAILIGLVGRDAPARGSNLLLTEPPGPMVSQLNPK
jgi:hypothetical protein